MLPLKIAARFLRTSPVQSALIVAGISVGIAVQIFVGSLITSLQADLIDTTIGSSSQVTILPAEGAAAVPGSIASDILDAEPLVKTAVPMRTLPGIYTSGGDSVPLTLKGADLKRLDTIYGLSDRVTRGDAALGAGETIVGEGFAEDFGVGVGDALTLLLPNGTTGELHVVGMFDLGAAAANDRLAFVDPTFARDALELGEDEWTSIEAQLSDVFASTTVAGNVAKEFNVKVTDWQTENGELLSGLQAQSSSSYMIQAFVLIAVALGIASTLAISAVQKTRQIGILKAMGMKDRQAGLVFLYSALILGGLGALGGVAIAYALLWGFSFAPVTFSIEPQIGFVALSAGVGIGVALLSSIIPARSTSRLDPIEVIQGG